MRRTSAPKLFVPLFIAFMGLAAFSKHGQQPKIRDVLRVDVVRLIASGMCFGAAMAALVIFFGGRRCG